MGQLEAELCAPDITPDMYGCDSAPEDPEWTHWLQGIMTSDMYNDGEGVERVCAAQFQIHSKQLPSAASVDGTFSQSCQKPKTILKCHFSQNVLLNH